MTPPAPVVGIPFFEPSAHPDAVLAAGAEPAPLRLAMARPSGGVALAREWVADATEVSCAEAGLDALLLASESPEELFGMLLAATRLDFPTVCAPPPGTPLSATLAALGLAPISGDAAGVTKELASNGGPRVGELLDNFSLANALRAGVAAGGGPELLVHLSALAREASVVGFSQMIRVLAPETPASDPSWTQENGAPALLTSLGEGLHDVPTVAGRLREGLPSVSGAPGEHLRLIFARARASGAEVVCRVPVGARDVAGECRVFGSEQEAVQAVRAGEALDGTVLVVNGCGPRGGGLLRLGALGTALREAGLQTPVVTDGLPPADATGTWACLFAPEAAMGGVIGRLRDGDALRLDLEGGLVRAGIQAGELEAREPFGVAERSGSRYAARYARSALPALEGAGFG